MLKRNQNFTSNMEKMKNRYQTWSPLALLVLLWDLWTETFGFTHGPLIISWSLSSVCSTKPTIFSPLHYECLRKESKVSYQILKIHQWWINWQICEWHSLVGESLSMKCFQQSIPSLLAAVSGKQIQTLWNYGAWFPKKCWMSCVAIRV